MKIINFPDLRQTFEYDCGAKALQSVLVYYGIEIREELLIRLAHTDNKKGTLIKDILNILDKYKLKYTADNMEQSDIKSYIDRKTPVIVLLQAWSDLSSKEYSVDYRDGHWVVAIGYDEENNFYFADPYAFETTYLTQNEFNARWHGQEYGKHIIKYGIAVYGKKPVFKSDKIIHMK